MNKDTAKTSEVLESAKQQRHAFLAEKVAHKKVLNSGELRELEHFENAVPGSPAVAAAPRQKRRRGKVSLAEVRQLGTECDNLTEAAVLFSGPGDLVELIEKRDSITAAWERGRLLRKVGQLAQTTVTVSAAAKELGLSGPELRDLLDNDAEVADLWEENRRRLRIRLDETMVEMANQGRPNAMRYVENFLRSEKTPAGFDYEHVPIKVMAEIVGKTRQTLHAWTRDAGLPRNPDCTYNLVEFLRWFEAATKAQAKSGPREDRLRAANAALRELEYQKTRADVLDRQAVENGLVTRIQNFLGYVENHLPATAADCEQKLAAEIELRLRQFIAGLREHMTEIPRELRLDKETAAQFKALLGRTEVPQEEAGDD